MENYSPIPCIQHERLEFAILRHLALNLEYREGEMPRREKVFPLDIYTREGAEWLKFKTQDGNERIIRLDAIRSFHELPA